VLVVLLLAVVLAALGPTGALANMANPVMPGTLLAEPSAELADVAIEGETLTFDARPLATSRNVAVEATYHVRNDGADRTVPIVFVAAAAGKGDSGIWLDGTPLPTEIRPADKLPAAWQPPTTTPGIGDQAPLAYHVNSGSAMLFDLPLKPGRHDVRVRYTAVATALSADSPARYWQIGYVLAPARAWASFGKLEVAVDLPPGFLAAADPPLARQGDRLAGSFDGVPADTLALTLQAPVDHPTDLAPVAWLGGLAVSLAVGALGGRWLGRRRRTSFWMLPTAALVGVLWMAALIVLGSQQTFAVPESQVAWTYGYGRATVNLFTSPLALVAGLIVTQGAAFVAARRARRVPAVGPHPSPALRASKRLPEGEGT